MAPKSRQTTLSNASKLAIILLLVMVCFLMGRYIAPPQKSVGIVQTRSKEIESPWPVGIANPESNRLTSEALPPEGSPLQANYSELIRRAGLGETKAAMRLFSDLTKCRLRHRQMKMLNHFSFPLSNDEGKPVAQSPLSKSQIPWAEKALSQLDSTDTLCDGITSEEIDRRGDALREAALGGDTEAMVCYAASTDFGPPYLSDAWFDYVERWKGEAIPFALRAFDAGQSDVLLILIEGLTPRNANSATTYQFSELVEPDQPMAYSLSILYQRLVPQAETEDAAQRVKRLEAGLSAHQKTVAEAFADSAWPRFASSAGQEGNSVPCQKYIYELTGGIH